MTSSRSTRSLVAACLFAVALMACSSGSPPPTAPEPNASVTFEYRAATALDAAVDFQTCTPEQVIFTVHLHFTWIEWDERRNMTANGVDRWTLTDGLPTGRRINVALHDPNNCLQGNVYIPPQNLFANGTLLTQAVDVQEGRGLSFVVLADGTVQP